MHTRSAAYTHALLLLLLLLKLLPATPANYSTLCCNTQRLLPPGCSGLFATSVTTSSAASLLLCMVSPNGGSTALTN
jgi:hypothetical protein